MLLCVCICACFCCVFIIMVCFCFFKVKSVLKDLAEKLNKPVTGCKSTSGTYQALHEHMVCIFGF